MCGDGHGFVLRSSSGRRRDRDVPARTPKQAPALDGDRAGIAPYVDLKQGSVGLGDGRVQVDAGATTLGIRRSVFVQVDARRLRPTVVDTTDGVRAVEVGGPDGEIPVGGGVMHQGRVVFPVNIRRDGRVGEPMRGATW